MPQKFLKNIDFIIPVPGKDYIKEECLYSTQFSCEHNGRITKWKLVYNFNDRETKHLGAYLEALSDGIDFDMQMTFIVLNWLDGMKSKSDKRKRLGNEWEKGSSWGVAKLLAQEELFAEENQYIKNGKIHLIVAIEEMPQTSEILSEENSLESENLKAQLDKIFNLMTSADDDSIILHTADGMKLKALKQTISKKSPVIAAMYETDMVEKLQGFVEIIDFCGKVMTELLRFMYVGRVGSIEEVDMDLYNAAKVYQVEGLTNICSMSIKSRIDASNVFEVVEFAYVHDETDLFEACCEIICRFLASDSVKDKMKKLPMEIQNRVYADNSSKFRGEIQIFCRVETE